MTSYPIIGLMSGTSTDGLDISYCHYQQDDAGIWTFKLLEAQNYPYEKGLQRKIKSINEASAGDFIQLDQELAKIWADSIQAFIHENGISKQEIDCIASHGQTICHQPGIGITTQ